MDRTLTEFIDVLRGAEVRVSTAESIDAMRVVDLIGFAQKPVLKTGLGLVLAKSEPEKHRFEACFDAFFSFENPEKQPLQPAPLTQEDGGMGQGEGMGAGGGAGSASAQSDLGQLLLDGDREGQILAIALASREAGLDRIAIFTQIGLFTRRIMEAMGLEALDAEIREGNKSDSLAMRNTADQLQMERDALRAQIRNRVERHFFLRAAPKSGLELERALRNAALSQLEGRHLERMKKLVRRMAKRLVALYSRRRRVQRRGSLDVRRTLRANAGLGGHLFKLRWKSRKLERPKVFAICDISGSVAAYARFLLMFLHSIQEVLPRVRSFVFSSSLGEITTMLGTQSLEQTMVTAERLYGGGATDYGQALLDFSNLCLNDITPRSTVIMLGDGRNNNGNPRTRLWKEICNRAQTVFWLNPESRAQWRIGDSQMAAYAPYCTRAQTVRGLQDLERVIDRMLHSV